jgi:hypothetical protein
MAREAGLYNEADGSPVEGFLLLRQNKANIPPMWIERAKLSRKNVEKELGKLLKSGDIDSIYKLREWEEKFKKEFFYLGMRVLLELERKGKSDL